MRPLALAIFLTLACAGGVRAQQQESKLVSRLLNWDMSLTNSMQGQPYYGGGGSSFDVSKSADVKSFDFIQKFSPKTFETKTYESKDYWDGGFQFQTKAATVKKDSDADKTFATKAAVVKDARETEKTGYDTKGYTTREAIEKGKTSQAHLNEMFLGKQQMNMDEVRDLLNKNHKAEPTEISSPQGQ